MRKYWFCIQVALSDTTVKTFEVSVEQFNQLRFGAAKVKNEMQQLKETSSHIITTTTRSSL
jgi:hypothetical protein